MNIPIDFSEQVEILNNEFKNRLNTDQRETITDGVMNPELYFANNIRLACMLKESYDSEDGTGGGWSLFDMFPEGQDLYEHTFKSPHKTTWQPIIYTSFGIFNNFKKWNELDWLSDDHSMCDIVRQIAIINSQKLPSKGVTSTDFKDLEESINNISDLVQKQIELLSPNVFIFGSTVSLYQSLFNFSLEDFERYNTVRYLLRDGKLYLDVYHPSQRSIKREDYVNDIISIVERFADKLD
jgi:hypothetical protein